MKPVDFEHGRRILSRQSAIVGAMHRAGVSIPAGSDSANPYTYPGFSLPEELARLVQSGLMPLDALQTATINPARYLGRQDTIRLRLTHS
jgi:imidazolonepropionase-like amidohydrolase